MSAPVLEATALRKSYRGRRVLDGIDLEMPHGETLVILGPSGCGKSTLLRCLVGLERPDQGVVRLQGVDLFDADTRTLAGLRERIGMTFQGGALFGSMTLAGNIDMPLSEYTRLPRSTRRIIARIKLGTVGLEDALDRYPSELSGGMRKRAALARAMALDPKILFCDEPSAGLDPITAASLDQLLNRLKRVFDVTLLVVTHEMASAFAIADRISMMHEGKIRICGPPEEVRASQDPVVRRFLDRVPRDSPGGEAGRGMFDRGEE
ncbi:MAG: ABC transporter ATP-binding protein [Candidatus Polarisedimenticolia bacterium]